MSVGEKNNDGRTVTIYTFPNQQGGQEMVNTIESPSWIDAKFDEAINTQGYTKSRVEDSIKRLVPPADFAQGSKILPLLDDNGEQVKSPRNEEVFIYDDNETQPFTYGEAMREHIARVVLNGSSVRDALRHNGISDYYSLETWYRCRALAPYFDTSMSIQDQCKEEGFSFTKIREALGNVDVNIARRVGPLKEAWDDNHVIIDPIRTDGEQLYFLGGNEEECHTLLNATKSIFVRSIYAKQTVKKTLTDLGINTATVRLAPQQKR
jgi:hypothetical protein